MVEDKVFGRPASKTPAEYTSASIFPCSKPPGPNERRVIVREHAGYYNALVVGAIYHFDPTKVNLVSTRTCTSALQHCVEQHPPLSAIVKRAETEAPVYTCVLELDLRNHIQILAASRSTDTMGDMEQIESSLPTILDTKWPDLIPSWKIIVLPLMKDEPGLERCSRCFVAFSYSHSLGDGISGLAFHRTFLAALQGKANPERNKDSLHFPSSSHAFPTPFDTPERLPISWSFLLAPFLGVYLPKFIASTLGFRAAASSITRGTWTATPAFYQPETYRTGLKLLEIDAQKLENAVKLCRQGNAKLTALIHQLIVRALSHCLPSDSNGFQ